jgi:molybdenum cofactor synthesis domain-containing protein
MKTEVVCVGNELLIGKTINTNASWIAKQIVNMGAMVKRIIVISDDVDEIASVLREALKRKPRFIITTGGLGPTFDDKTLEGIAKALNRKVEVNPKALQMVKEKYETLLKAGRIESYELTPARIKMATIPEKAEPLPNHVGTAPGVLIRVQESVIIALPGVPPEMESIFEESVVPLLKREIGKLVFVEKSIYAVNVVESVLAPLIDQTMHDNPLVYIKSHVYSKSRPRGEEKRAHIELHFSITAKEPRLANEQLKKAILQMTDLIKKSGGRTRLEE